MFPRACGAIPRAKIFLWGDGGSGKTTFALRWSQLGGKIAVIDLEGSSSRYDKEFEFYRQEPKSIEAFRANIKFLSTERHEFTTLLIDPITVLWEMFQKHWEEKFLRTRSGKIGHNGDYYVLQPADWKQIGAYWFELMRDIIRLDMNIIATSHMKALYAAGEMMNKIGDTYDCQKKTHYYFDTNMMLTSRPETGQYIASVTKHRSFMTPMPSTIDITGANMGYFKTFFGDSITRRSDPIKKVDQETIEKINSLCLLLNVTEERKVKSLSKFGASSTEDLFQDQAEEILGKLEEKVKVVSPF